MKIAQLLLISIFMLVGKTARAEFLVLDNFAVPSTAGLVLIGPSPNSGVLSSPTGFGSTRTGTYTVNFPASPNNFDLVVQQGAGRLDFNSSVFARANANLFYDTFTGGANNFNSNGTPFRLLLGFNTIDPGLNVSTASPALDIPLDVVISTSSGTLSGTFSLASTNTPIVYALPLASFNGVGDLSNVISVNFTFNGGPNQRQAVDFVLTNIQFETFVAPAPPALMVALAGVPVLGLIRRYRRA